MGITYTLYCEAKIGDKWYNIDFYQRPLDGAPKLTPVIWGKSVIRSAIDWYVHPVPLDAGTLSDVTRGQESDKAQDYQWKFIPGSWFIGKELDTPEYCGYFPKQEVLDFKSGLTDMICSEDMLDTEAYLALPDEGKIAYQYFEWTEEWGPRYVLKLIQHGVEERIRACNEWLFSIPKELRGNTDGISWGDVRLVVFID